MGLNSKVMLSYHKWTYDADICGSSLELMSHVVWGGSLTLALLVIHSAAHPVGGTTNSTLADTRAVTAATHEAC